MAIGTIRVDERKPHGEEHLCPVCGEMTYLIGRTKDGRVILSCGDACDKDSWEKEAEEAEDECA